MPYPSDKADSLEAYVRKTISLSPHASHVYGAIRWLERDRSGFCNYWNSCPNSSESAADPDGRDPNPSDQPPQGQMTLMPENTAIPRGHIHGPILLPPGEK